MTSQRFNRSALDNRIYFKRLENGSYMFLLLDADDRLRALKNIADSAKLKGN